MMNRNLNQSQLNGFIPTPSEAVLSPLIEREWNGSTKDQERDQHAEKCIEDQNPQIDSSNIVDDVIFDDPNQSTLIEVKTTPNVKSPPNFQAALQQTIENSYVHAINKTLDMLFEDNPIEQNQVESTSGIIPRKSLAHRVSVEPVRSPLGVVRFRKVNLHNDNLDNTESVIYEIAMPQLTEMNNKRDGMNEESQRNERYPLNVNSPIATRTRTRDIRLPFSPRIVLDRINSIDEYNSKFSAHQAASKNKRKRRQTKKGIQIIEYI